MRICLEKKQVCLHILMLEILLVCFSLCRTSLLKRPGLWNETSEKTDRIHSDLVWLTKSGSDCLKR